MSVVEAESLGKAFGRTRVLRDVTLRVDAGETLVLFGPNGAGKSTLLRLCATIYAPTAGSLRLFGSLEREASTRRRIGVVSHQSFLYPDLSASENLAFYARLYALPEPERIAAEWLTRVGLAGTGTRPVRAFSRGMEQRLALARALLHAPDLLLLDEPWSALDAAAADLLSDLLVTSHADGRTVIVATHDFERGLAIADRAMILHDGRVAWQATRTAGELGAFHEAYRRITGAVAA
ncbi:MAG TPA: ABC transporter ATP-binding protein [Candidatus Binatia bacterium]|jgi:heme exporter protein A